ncbi:MULTISPECIES: N-acetyltransferase [unclassified Leucobacter]|uniref:GNAT family N-acetyltransferase n=1 Tax=unclassified Leucobacter TaxID=2621730 RepID=UPI00165E1419|nr:MULTISPECIES: GNAT family N-acetyltransferase [unclassified Leucobacter]MBC9928592.1 GNAT family N-acetyltransferase [Leucobacter sp. cx-169]
MTLRLAPISSDQFPAWVERSIAEYAADLVTTGVAPGEARRRAAESMAEEFPGGAPSAENAVFDLVAGDGAIVGYLWVGEDHSDDPTSWWVWDVVVDAGQRGQGHGRAAMRLAEAYARSEGATMLGLSVFRFNVAARGLYEALGYEITGSDAVSIKMSKRL